MKRWTSLWVILTTIATIGVNLLANLLPLNGQNTGEISDRYPVEFVPAGYVFSIWGVIYVLMILYTFYQARREQKENRALDEVGRWYIVGQLANIVWLFLWHYNYPVLTVIPMLILLGSLVSMYEVTRKSPEVGGITRLMTSVYLGWISVATIANVTVALYVLKWGGLGISGEYWTAVLIGVATTLAFLLISQYRDVGYASVIVWAIIGLAVKFPASTPIVYAAMAGSGLLAGLMVRALFSKRAAIKK